MPKDQGRKPLEIKISTMVTVSAILRESDPAILNAAMLEMTGGEADYFDDEFAVLDVAACQAGKTDIDWPALVAMFKAYRLNPVAVRNASPEMKPAILGHGLSIDAAVKARREEPAAVIQPAPAPVQQERAAARTMIVDTPVRAGQRVYARGADLIVTAIVNSGAEIIADGSIHVYAPLRGRALAGASGDAAARVFTMSMEAELVSIAGMYRTFEDGFRDVASRVPAQIRLNGDRIEVLPLNSK
jgi:septum site-determining protein MinC